MHEARPIVPEDFASDELVSGVRANGFTQNSIDDDTQTRLYEFNIGFFQRKELQSTPLGAVFSSMGRALERRFGMMPLFNFTPDLYSYDSNEKAVYNVVQPPFSSYIREIREKVIDDDWILSRLPESVIDRSLNNSEPFIYGYRSHNTRAILLNGKFYRGVLGQKPDSEVSLLSRSLRGYYFGLSILRRTIELDPNRLDLDIASVRPALWAVKALRGGGEDVIRQKIDQLKRNLMKKNEVDETEKLCNQAYEVLENDDVEKAAFYEGGSLVIQANTNGRFQTVCRIGDEGNKAIQYALIKKAWYDMVKDGFGINLVDPRHLNKLFNTLNPQHKREFEKEYLAGTSYLEDQKRLMNQQEENARKLLKREDVKERLPNPIYEIGPDLYSLYHNSILGYCFFGIPFKTQRVNIQRLRDLLDQKNWDLSNEEARSLIGSTRK